MEALGLKFYQIRASSSVQKAELCPTQHAQLSDKPLVSWTEIGTLQDRGCINMNHAEEAYLILSYVMLIKAIVLCGQETSRHATLPMLQEVRLAKSLPDSLCSSCPLTEDTQSNSSWRKSTIDTLPRCSAVCERGSSTFEDDYLRGESSSIVILIPDSCPTLVAWPILIQQSALAQHHMRNPWNTYAAAVCYMEISSFGLFQKE